MIKVYEEKKPKTLISFLHFDRLVMQFIWYEKRRILLLLICLFSYQLEICLYMSFQSMANIPFALGYRCQNQECNWHAIISSLWSSVYILKCHLIDVQRAYASKRKKWEWSDNFIIQNQNKNEYKYVCYYIYI